MINDDVKKSKKPLKVVLFLLLIVLCFGGILIFNNVRKEEKKEEKTEEIKEEKEKNEDKENKSFKTNDKLLSFYCSEFFCTEKKESIEKDDKLFEYQCNGEPKKDCYIGTRDENFGTPIDQQKYYTIGLIYDDGHLIIDRDSYKYTYNCISKNCYYINNNKNSLFIYDDGVFLIDMKNNKKTKLDLTFNDVFEGDKTEDEKGTHYIDGIIDFYKIEKYDNNGNKIEDEYSDHLLIYNSSNSSQCPDTYIYNLNNNSKTKRYYCLMYSKTINGKEYIIASSDFEAPGYVSILNPDSLMPVVEFNDSDRILLDEKKKQILVASYNGCGYESDKIEDCYDVKHKLDYNFKEIK